MSQDVRPISRENLLRAAHEANLDNVPEPQRSAIWDALKTEKRFAVGTFEHVDLKLKCPVCVALDYYGLDLDKRYEAATEWACRWDQQLDILLKRDKDMTTTFYGVYVNDD